LTSSLFGIVAGTLGLESYSGFALYLIGTLLVSLFIFVFRSSATPTKYFHNPAMDLWLGDLFGGLSSFVLTWTLFYGLLRA
jgi:ER membrane protein complex subunit 6